MKKIRVGIIGTGFGSTVHAPMMMDHEGFEVTSIASVSRGRTDQIKEQTGIDNVYANWKDMLDKEELDLVSITSAPFLHHEMVIESLKHSHHVLCEKPMAMNAEQSLHMIKNLEEKNKYGLVNFEFRFLPARMKVKEILKSGKLGRIIHINYRGIYQGYHRNFKKKNWLGQQEYGGGMLGALGSHMIDSLLWWKQNKINAVFANLMTHFPEYVDEKGDREIRTAEDSFQIIGDFVDGTTFTIDFMYSSRNASGWGLEIHGTKGTLTMTDDQVVNIGFEDSALQVVDLAAPLKGLESMSDYTKKYYGAFHPMLNALYDTIINNYSSPNLATFEDGYQVQLVLDAARESAKTNKKIFIQR